MPGGPITTYNTLPPPHPVVVDVHSNFYIEAELLSWWFSKSPISVPLLTVSSPADLGVLGAPTTRVLIGDEQVNTGVHRARFTFGGWLDAPVGVEGGFFFTGSRTTHIVSSVPGSRQDAVIAVPFLDVNPAFPGESSALVSFPNAFSGAAT